MPLPCIVSGHCWKKSNTWFCPQTDVMVKPLGSTSNGLNCRQRISLWGKGWGWSCKVSINSSSLDHALLIYAYGVEKCGDLYTKKPPWEPVVSVISPSLPLDEGTSIPILHSSCFLFFSERDVYVGLLRLYLLAFRWSLRGFLIFKEYSSFLVFLEGHLILYSWWRTPSDRCHWPDLSSQSCIRKFRKWEWIAGSSPLLPALLWVTMPTPFYETKLWGQ